MNNPPVINASPLIFLSRSGCMDLLQNLYHEILIPKPVAEEIFIKGKSDITVKSIQNKKWLKIVEAPKTPENIIRWNLGKGESSVLSLALSRPGTEVIIDDLLARKCAILMDIPLRGTLGIVLVLKKRGVIKSARNIIEKLVEHGMYLSPKTIEKALRRVDE